MSVVHYVHGSKQRFKEMNMFKKVLIGVLLAAVLALGIAGIVFAQGPTEPGEETCPFDGTCGRLGGGFGMGGFGYHGTMPSILAEELGMTLDELSAALAEGKTVAAIAAQQGVSLEDLVAALVAERAEDLSQAVADGRLTQEQADWMLKEMTEHLTWRLENMSFGGLGGYGGGCGMHGGGWGMQGGEWGMQGGGRGYRGGRGMRGGVWRNGAAAPRSLSDTL
jgi:hypothetical protein